MLHIGDFKLDQERRLLLNEQSHELEIEAKSMDVLLYLIDNRDRYVTLQELHDDLWAGRIVSDSAVRQSIARLRKVLNDPAEQPRYIKSVAKKGYRFIASTDQLSTESTLLPQSEPQPPPKNTKRHWFLARKRWLWSLPLLVVLLILFESSVTVSTHHPLSDGKHVFFTTSDNASFYYIEQVQLAEHYRVWRYDGETDHTIDNLDHEVLYPVLLDGQLVLGWNQHQQCGLHFYTNHGQGEKNTWKLPDCTTLLHVSRSESSLLLTYHKRQGDSTVTEVASITTDARQPDVVLTLPTAMASLQANLNPNTQELLLASGNLKQTNVQLYQQNAQQHFELTASFHVPSGGLKQAQHYADAFYLLVQDGVYRLNHGEVSYALESQDVLDLAVVDKRLTLLRPADTRRFELFRWNDASDPPLSAALFEADTVLPARTTRYIGQQRDHAYTVRKDRFKYKVVHLASNTVMLSSSTPIELLHFDEQKQWLIYAQQELLVVYHVVSKQVDFLLHLPGELIGWDLLQPSGKHQLALFLLQQGGVEPFLLNYDQGQLLSLANTTAYQHKLDRGTLQQDQITAYLSGAVRLLSKSIGSIEQPVMTEQGLFFTRMSGRRYDLFFIDHETQQLQQLAVFDTPVYLVRNDQGGMLFYTRPIRKTQIDIVNQVI